MTERSLGMAQDEALERLGDLERRLAAISDSDVAASLRAQIEQLRARYEAGTDGAEDVVTPSGGYNRC